MLIENIRAEAENYFVMHNLIPLGINTWRGNRIDKHGIVAVPYKKNGSIVIIATSGWGKSVMLKRVIDYVLGLFTKKKDFVLLFGEWYDIIFNNTSYNCQLEVGR